MPMPVTIYYENDADLSHPEGQEELQFFGYGIAGSRTGPKPEATAVVMSIIGQRTRFGQNFDLAVSHGFEPMSDCRGHQGCRTIW